MMGGYRKGSGRKKGCMPWNKGLRGVMPKHAGFQKGHGTFLGAEKGWFTTERVSGANNVNWKGNNVKYGKLHDWIRYHLGKATKCIWCGKETGIEWANISKEYKRDLDDYMQLCKKCHAKYDNRGLKIKNNKTTGHFLKKSRGGDNARDSK